jgi:hypothetical protein
MQRDLNDRFKVHIQRARRVRLAATSLLCVCVLAGAGLATAKIAPRVAFASLHSTFAQSQVAAASSWFDRLRCAIFGGCDAEPEFEPVTERRLPAPQPTPAAPVLPAATPTREMTPQPVQQTIVQQPVIERVVETVRTVSESGLAVSYLEQRLASVRQEFAGALARLATTQQRQDELIFEAMNDIGSDPGNSGSGSTDASSISGTITNAITRHHP